MKKRDFTRLTAFFTASVVSMCCILAGYSSIAIGKADPDPTPTEITLRIQNYNVQPSPAVISAVPASTEIAKTPEPKPEPEYDYSVPVAESEPVDDSYFDNAVFVGDSRTDGLRLWGGQKNMRALFGVGLNVKSIFTEQVADGNSKTIIEALREMDFSSVYICLGINELGWADPLEYKECYRNIISTIREMAPDADIYVQEIIPVTYMKTISDGTYNNENIAIFNGLLRELVVEEKVYFITVSEALVDENGCLPEEASTDGVHMYPSYYEKWIKYIKTHTVGAN